jgi:hypothetical protein
MVNLKMVAGYFFEISMTAYQTAWHHIPEDSGFRINCCHNLRYSEGIPVSLSLCPHV